MWFIDLAKTRKATRMLSEKLGDFFFFFLVRWFVTFSLLILLGPMGGTALKRKKQERLTIWIYPGSAPRDGQGNCWSLSPAMTSCVTAGKQSPIRVLGVQSSTWLLGEGSKAIWGEGQVLPGNQHGRWKHLLRFLWEMGDAATGSSPKPDKSLAAPGEI